MPVLELLLLTLVIVMVAIGGLSIRLFFSKDKQFRGGSCQASHSSGLSDKGISCGCGGGSCATEATKN
ncbi:MAG: hypothetical protein R6U66_14475 [Bacteroidales bacterium]|jgi:hypothetical protein